jgi:hypothetical protein
MPALVVIAPGKSNGKSMPPPKAPGKGKRREMPPPTITGAPAQEPDDDDEGLTPAEVGYGSGDRCQDCAHLGQDGDCSKYHFSVSPDGHCLAGFEPAAPGQGNVA